MNVVDSSGWLEYFANGPNAGFFSAPIENSADLIVPTISLFEVFKRVLQQTGETEALRAIAFMHSGQVVDLSTPLALHAAKLSLDLKIPMADSIMLATAREYDAILWTQDTDFEGLDGVRFIHHS
jgi:predicted nucleic acid-binding protein